jgi:hypothetical protein
MMRIQATKILKCGPSALNAAKEPNSDRLLREAQKRAHLLATVTVDIGKQDNPATTFIEALEDSAEHSPALGALFVPVTPGTVHALLK